MLVELRVENLGIIADLVLLLGPGMTAITGETGAGKTLIVDALELLVGGRADPSLVRDGARRSARRRPLRRSRHGRRDRARPCRCPRVGRSRALHRRPARDRDRARRARRDARRPPRPARAPVVARSRRCNAPRSTVSWARPRLDALASYRAARADDPPRRRRARRARRRRTCRGARDRPAALPARRDRRPRPSTIPARKSRSKRKSCSSPTPARTATRSGRAYATLEGPALDALGRAIAALDGRAPFAELSARVRAAAGRDRRCGARHAASPPSRSPTTRNGSPTSAAGASSCASSAASTATRSPTSPRTRSRPVSGSRRSRDTRPGRTRSKSERGDARTGGARGVDRADGRPSGRGGTARRAVEAHLRELAMPAATLEVEVEAGEATEDGADHVTFLLAPNPGESRPAARQGRVRWRAGARDAGARASCSSHAPPDPRVRRSRRGDRRRGRHRRRTRCSRRWVHATRCCASRTSRRSRRLPTRRSWWRRLWCRSRRNGQPGPTHRGHGRHRRRRRAGRRAVADARRGRGVVARPPPRRRAARRRAGQIERVPA